MHLKVPDFTNPLVFIEIQVGEEKGEFIKYFCFCFFDNFENFPSSWKNGNRITER